MFVNAFKFDINSQISEHQEALYRRCIAAVLVYLVNCGVSSTTGLTSAPKPLQDCQIEAYEGVVAD